MIRNIIEEIVLITDLNHMESTPETNFIIAIGAIVVAITAFAIYTAFGPPAKELADPFDDHDD